MGRCNAVNSLTNEVIFDYNSSYIHVYSGTKTLFYVIVNPIVTYPDNTLLLARCHFCVDLDVERARNVHSYPCQFVLGVIGEAKFKTIKICNAIANLNTTYTRTF